MKKRTAQILFGIVSVLLALSLGLNIFFFARYCKPVGEQPPEKTPDAETVADRALSHAGYTLEKVVVLSRHNIRSPLSGGGSLLSSVTPHEWFKWTSGASELSLRGGALETFMGQFFRKWLESEGLFPENYLPGEGEVRVYANSKQRTIATAEYFVSGLLPTANVPIEYHVEFDKMDPTFTPQLTFVSDAYVADAEAEIRERFQKTIDGLKDNYALLTDLIDLKASEAWKNGDVGAFVTDDLTLKLEAGAEPGMSGSLKTACSVSDALVLQYYEEADEKKAAFGKTLSLEDWRAISRIKDVYGDVLFTSPLIAPNVAHPLLREIRSEMLDGGRVFTFLCGHDSNVGSVLASLGVTDYTAPEAIESKTPIGCKLVFSRWRSAGGEAFWSVDLVYQSVDQLRSLSMLDLDHPPVVFPIDIPGVAKNADGLYEAQALMTKLDDAVAGYDALVEAYSLDAAA